MAKRRLPGDMAVLLGSLALLLYCFQYITLVKFDILPPGISYRTLPRFLQAVQEKVALGAVDALLAGAILALCVAVSVLEWRRRRLALFLGYIFAGERRTLLFLAACNLVFARFYFATGGLGWGADAAGHITYALITAEAIARGELPFWTNYLGLGSPYLQFYGFLFYYVVGVVQLACGDLYTSIKLVLGASHVLSGVGMYLWIRCATCSRRAAFVGGVAYVLSFWHVQQVVLMGRLPLGLFYALLPWPFYFFERLRRNKPWGAGVAGAGATLGLLAFTHPGYAFWATIFWGLYVLVRLGGVWGLRRFAGLLKGSVAAGVGSVGLGAYLTVGMLLEREATGLHDGIELSGVADPGWLQVFSWSNFRFWLLPTGVDHWYGGYVGLSLIALAIGSLLVLARSRGSWRYEPLVPAWLGLALALVLVFGYRWSVLEALPVVQAFNAGRYLVFVVFFLAFAAGVGTRVLLVGRRSRQDRVLALLLLAVVADLGATTFQHPYTAPGTQPLAVNPLVYDLPRRTAEPFRQRGELPGYRIAWVRDSHPPFMAMAQMVYRTATPVPSAPSEHNLRAVAEFYLPIKQWADQLSVGIEDDPHEDSLWRREFIEQGLGLLNIRYMLMGTEGGSQVVEQRHHTPLVAAPTAVPIPTDLIDSLLRERGVEDEGEMVKYRAYWLVRGMEVDLMRDRCIRIFLAEGASGQEMGDPGTKLEVSVLGHRVWNERVEVRVRVSAPCFARLAYAYYPHLQVSVDGEEVEPLQTAGRFMALRLNPGEHTIRIEARLSPLRAGLLALGGLLGVGGALMAWRSLRGGRASDVGAVKTAGAGGEYRANFLGCENSS